MSLLLDLLVRPFEYLADHPKWLTIPVVIGAVSLVAMNTVDVIMPDLTFGFTYENDIRPLLFDNANGCEAYIYAATIELMPFIESYITVLGTLLVYACRRHAVKEQYAVLLVYGLFLCDVLETWNLRQLCTQPPPPDDTLSSSFRWRFQIARTCNQAKWITLMTTCLSILLAFRVPPSDAAKIAQANKVARAARKNKDT